MKRFLIIAGIVVGIVVLALVLVPFFINVDSFRPQLEEKLAAALGRTVHVGRLEASLFSGGAKANTISISDDPAFSKGPFLQASSVQIGLEMLPLIFSRQIKVTSITVESPEIVLLKNSAGKWNYSTLGTTGATSKPRPKPIPRTDDPPAAAGSSVPADFSVGKFEIVNGKVRLGQSAGHAGTHERVYQKVHLLVKDISATTAMPFTLSAETPGGGSLEVEGQAGPLDQKDAAKTPLEAKVAVEHADLASSGLFDAGSGLAGIVDFEGKVKSDGTKLHSEGTAKANSLKLVRGGGPARQPISLEYNSDFGLDSDLGTVSAKVHTGGSTATANGTLNAHGETTVAHLKLQGKNMAVNDVEGLLPAFGVTLPSGASLQGGTINTDLTADGPLDRLVIAGPVDVANTRLTGYDLSSKLGAMAALTGIKPSSDTLIQTCNSGLRVAPEGIRADSIFLDVPSIGQLTGGGVISPSNALNFRMSLKLTGAAGSPVGGLANLIGGGQGKGVPFTIGGTAASPEFRPDVSSALKSNILGNDQQGIGGVLGGLFGKKKNQQQTPK